MQQYHLTGRGFSGRAVRVKALDPSQCEENLIAAAKAAGPEALGLELKKIEWRNGIKLFVKQVSDVCSDPVAPGVKWKKVSPVDLEDLSAYFTSKDIKVLEDLFRNEHEVLQAEVDAIVGKAIAVSEG